MARERERDSDRPTSGRLNEHTPHHTEQRLSTVRLVASEECVEVRDKDRGDVLREARGGHVRRHVHARVRPERAVRRQRLGLEHVEHGAREQASVERIHELALGDDAAAADVDERRLLGAAARERGGIQQVERRGRARQHAHDKVRGGERVLQVVGDAVRGRAAAVAAAGEAALEAHDLEARGFEQLADALANVPEAQHAHSAYTPCCWSSLARKNLRSSATIQLLKRRTRESHGPRRKQQHARYDTSLSPRARTPPTQTYPSTYCAMAVGMMPPARVSVNAGSPVDVAFVSVSDGAAASRRWNASTPANVACIHCTRLSSCCWCVGSALARVSSSGARVAASPSTTRASSSTCVCDGLSDQGDAGCCDDEGGGMSTISSPRARKSSAAAPELAPNEPRRWRTASAMPWMDDTTGTRRIMG
ncbi:hypothetical protein PybrP1_004820, partial [[Pythium] brassicae (nom. inval.)]